MVGEFQFSLYSFIAVSLTDLYRAGKYYCKEVSRMKSMGYWVVIFIGLTLSILGCSSDERLGIRDSDGNRVLVGKGYTVVESPDGEVLYRYNQIKRQYEQLIFSPDRDTVYF
jgi:hypothetical protein